MVRVDLLDEKELDEVDWNEDCVRDVIVPDGVVDAGLGPGDLVGAQEEADGPKAERDVGADGEGERGEKEVSGLEQRRPHLDQVRCQGQRVEDELEHHAVVGEEAPGPIVHQLLLIFVRPLATGTGPGDEGPYESVAIGEGSQAVEGGSAEAPEASTRRHRRASSLGLRLHG